MTDVPILTIVQGCCQGDATAQRELFRRTHANLLKVCSRYARDRPEAQDMLQEAYLTIFKDLPQYKGAGSFEGWAHRVTARTALRYIRRKHVLRFAETIDDLQLEKNSWQPDAAMEHDNVVHLLQQLPTGYRLIFNMRCLEGFSYEEIAAELNIAEVSVRSQYSRACKQLRKLIFLVDSFNHSTF
jgi:RNA polymerase sigma factor (sigma-70 family)